jgi:hypothetical protein
MTTTKTRRLRRGDYVRERDGDGRIGFITMTLREDAELVVVVFPPSREGFVYHVDDLSKA